MQTIEWSSDYSVRISEIDEQHKRLFSMLNSLIDAMKKGRGRSVISDIINEMFEYTQSHFALEEKYFDMYDYPETVSHVAEHNSFIKKVEEFKIEFEEGSSILTIEVLDFLSKWLKHHIKDVDRQYSSFMTEKGLR